MIRMNEVRKDDTRNILSDIKLFEGLTPTQLDWVAKHAHRRVFAAGTNVMTIEQPGEAVFIILHGTVKIHVEQGERDVILSVLGSGDLLGRDEFDRQRGTFCQRIDFGKLAHAVDGQNHIQLSAR